VLAGGTILLRLKEIALERPKGEGLPLIVHQGRALEAGRGRRAHSPLQIPWAGWKDILWRTFKEIQADHMPSVAAGVTFFSLLAMFPAITAAVSSYGLFTDPFTMTTHLAIVADIVPAGALDIIREQIDRIAGRGGGKLTAGFLIGLAVALWSANAGMKALFEALNIIYEEEEKRGFFRLNLVSLTFTIGAVGVVLLAIGAVIVVPLVLSYIGFGYSDGFTERLVAWLRWPMLFLLVLLALAVLFRYGPSRHRARWRWVSVGTVVATLLWLAVSGAFSWYLANFANYDKVYGSLGAVIGLMMWMWLSTLVVLAGAELDSEIEHQTAQDTTVGGEKPLGWRGAAMADTVGKAVTSGAR
jgi:membrane protein